MVAHKGISEARALPHVPLIAGALAHLTRFGGWKHYLVLASQTTEDWHIGWRWSMGAGVSRVPVSGPVRVLVGPDPTEWFGISAYTNRQVPIHIIGEGRIGEGGKFSQVPLF
jgi:hypothetical protein